MAQFERAPDHDPLISSSYQPGLAQHDSMYSTRTSEFGLDDSPPQQQPAAYNSLYNYAASPSATPMASFSDSPRFSSEQQQPLYGGVSTPPSRFGSISASTLNVSSQQETRYEINAMDLDHSPEADDELHDPGDPPPLQGPARMVYDGNKTQPSHNLSFLGVLNALAVFLLVAALLFVFAGWPLMSHFREDPNRYNQGTNNTGQVPTLSLGSYGGMIDDDTPQSARTIRGMDGDEYHLVFSDEFEQEGRTFGPGDDPYWEAVEIHYGATQDMEYYRANQVTTRDGSAVFTLDWADPDTNGNLAFVSGMLQSWNKFCFRGGIIEFNVSFPGDDESSGFWAAGWTMGNLGRPGYLASTQGVWPYSYEACDVGTLPNQTYADDSSLPEAALDGEMSFLPGQRLSSCTCQGEDHPGPKKDNGSFVGRSAPEIDLWEVAADHSSQSFQVAPYDKDQCMFNDSRSIDVNSGNDFDTEINEWKGNVWQEAASCISYIPDQGWSDFMTWALEYEPSTDDSYDGHITWINGGQRAWTMHERALRANSETEVGQRIVPREPMTVVLNFALSESFAPVLFDQLTIPNEMVVDYVRVYQKEGKYDVGCDGVNGDWPTTDYINDHLDVFTNPNLTLWSDTPYEWPKSALLDNCQN